MQVATNAVAAAIEDRIFSWLTILDDRYPIYHSFGAAQLAVARTRAFAIRTTGWPLGQQLRLDLNSIGETSCPL